MIVSEARREANRRNTLLSTGPRTEAGKDRSRRNALTHGLSAAVVRLPEDEPAALPGAEPDRGPADPVADWPAWLAEQVAVIASRLRRCDRLDRRHRARVARRAESHWDDDRRLEAEFLGSGLARDPAAVARSLRMSPHGCDWMIERWALLARAADREGTWTAEQRALAFDLLGRPCELRGGDPTEAIDPEGRPDLATPAAADLAALARREVAALRRRKTEVAPADALDRAAARTDPDIGDDPDLRKLQRHEFDLHRRLRWCVAQLAKADTPPPPPPAPPPIPLPAPRPEPAEALGVDPVARFKSMMGWAEAKAQADAKTSDLPIAAAPRPDPRAALEKARQADRRRKRDRRRS